MLIRFRRDGPEGKNVFANEFGPERRLATVSVSRTSLSVRYSNDYSRIFRQRTIVVLRFYSIVFEKN